MLRAKAWSCSQSWLPQPDVSLHIRTRIPAHPPVWPPPAVDAWGTFAWAAPEQLLGQRCSTKADIYAYGEGAGEGHGQ